MAPLIQLVTVLCLLSTTLVDSYVIIRGNLNVGQVLFAEGNNVWIRDPYEGDKFISNLTVPSLSSVEFNATMILTQKNDPQIFYVCGYHALARECYKIDQSSFTEPIEKFEQTFYTGSLEEGDDFWNYENAWIDGVQDAVYLFYKADGKQGVLLKYQWSTGGQMVLDMPRDSTVVNIEFYDGFAYVGVRHQIPRDPHCESADVFKSVLFRVCRSDMGFGGDTTQLISAVAVEMGCNYTLHSGHEKFESRRLSDFTIVDVFDRSVGGVDANGGHTITNVYNTMLFGIFGDVGGMQEMCEFGNIIKWVEYESDKEINLTGLHWQRITTPSMWTFYDFLKPFQCDKDAALKKLPDTRNWRQHYVPRMNGKPIYGFNKEGNLNASKIIAITKHINKINFDMFVSTGGSTILERNTRGAFKPRTFKAPVLQMHSIAGYAYLATTDIETSARVHVEQTPRPPAWVQPAIQTEVDPLDHEIAKWTRIREDETHEDCLYTFRDDVSKANEGPCDITLLGSNEGFIFGYAFNECVKQGGIVYDPTLVTDSMGDTIIPISSDNNPPTGTCQKGAVLNQDGQFSNCGNNQRASRLWYQGERPYIKCDSVPVFDSKNGGWICKGVNGTEGHTHDPYCRISQKACFLPTVQGDECRTTSQDPILKLQALSFNHCLKEGGRVTEPKMVWTNDTDTFYTWETGYQCAQPPFIRTDSAGDSLGYVCQTREDGIQSIIKLGHQWTTRQPCAYTTYVTHNTQTISQSPKCMNSAFKLDVTHEPICSITKKACTFQGVEQSTLKNLCADTKPNNIPLAYWPEQSWNECAGEHWGTTIKIRGPLWVDKDHLFYGIAERRRSCASRPYWNGTTIMCEFDNDQPSPPVAPFALSFTGNKCLGQMHKDQGKYVCRIEDIQNPKVEGTHPPCCITRGQFCEHDD